MKEIYRTGLKYLNRRIENQVIENHTFQNCIFEEIVDDRNRYINCMFHSCKFKNCYIGYNKTVFENCSFINNTLKTTSFICPDFNNVNFEGTLKNIDFKGSCFSHVTFKGYLDDVWFRGKFKKNGIANLFKGVKHNPMKNVDLRNCKLNNLVFSDSCPLEHVHISDNSIYLKIQQWEAFLNFLIRDLEGYSDNFKFELDIFYRSRIIHAKNQNDYILNTEDLKEEFGGEISSFIETKYNSWKK